MADSFVLLKHCCDTLHAVCVCVQDHDVQEEKILLVSLLMAEMGVHSVAYAFPQVKIITTAVDKKVNDLFHIIPGIGETLLYLLDCGLFSFTPSSLGKIYVYTNRPVT